MEVIGVIDAADSEVNKTVSFFLCASSNDEGIGDVLN